MPFIEDISFADPSVWIIGGIILFVATFIMIYFRVFVGEGRVRR